MNERILFSSKHEFEKSIFNSIGTWVLIILAAIVSWGAIIVVVSLVLYVSTCRRKGTVSLLKLEKFSMRALR